jgi:hypothetical protein
VLARWPVNCERLLRVQVGLRVIVQLSTATIAASLLAEAGPRCLAAAHASAQGNLDAFAAPLPVQQPGAASSALLRRASDDLAALHARQVPLPSMLLRVFSVLRRPPSQIVQPSCKCCATDSMHLCPPPV